MEGEQYLTHQRAAKIHGAYTAFIAALVVALISGDGHISTEGLAISFWLISLPWLVSLVFLDLIVRVVQEREKSATRGLFSFMGYGLSIIGNAILLWHFSILGSLVFLISTPICILCTFQVLGLGKKKGFEEL